MRLAVAGSCPLDNIDEVFAQALAASGFTDITLVCVTAPGVVEAAALKWAKLNNNIYTAVFTITPAQWETKANLARLDCNRQIASCAQALLAIGNVNDFGTSSMITEARKRGLKLYVHTT